MNRSLIGIESMLVEGSGGSSVLRFGQTSSTMQTHQTALFFVLTYFLSSKPVYNMILRLIPVRYDLMAEVLYDIHLRATTTTILSIRGATIPIDLVSLSSCVNWVKLRRTCRPPLNPPCMPGISLTPSQPRITHIATVLVLSLSIWRRSYASNELNVLVTASPLKSSWTFHLNVTIWVIVSIHSIYQLLNNPLHAQLLINWVSSTTARSLWCRGSMCHEYICSRSTLWIFISSGSRSANIGEGWNLGDFLKCCAKSPLDPCLDWPCLLMFLP